MISIACSFPIKYKFLNKTYLVFCVNHHRDIYWVILPVVAVPSFEAPHRLSLGWQLPVYDVMPKKHDVH